MTAGPSAPAATPSTVLPPQRRLPRPWLAVTLPLFAGVAIGLAGVSFINSYTELRCERSDDAVTGGSCNLERGSFAFDYDEMFFVRDLVRATVEGAGSDVKDRARDGLGERVYVWAGQEPYRIIDNGEWSRARRDREAARINAFIADEGATALVVRYDRRWRLLAKGFAFGLLFGLPFAMRRWRRSRLTADDIALGERG